MLAHALPYPATLGETRDVSRSRLSIEASDHTTHAAQTLFKEDCESVDVTCTERATAARETRAMLGAISLGSLLCDSCFMTAFHNICDWTQTKSEPIRNPLRNNENTERECRRWEQHGSNCNVSTHHPVSCSRITRQDLHVPKVACRWSPGMAAGGQAELSCKPFRPLSQNGPHGSTAHTSIGSQ